MDNASIEKAAAAFETGRAEEARGNLAGAMAKYRECLRERPGRLLWEFEAGADTSKPVVHGGVPAAVVVDGVAYALSYDDHLCALDARGGALLWDLTGNDTVSLPAVVDGVSYVAGDYCRAFDVGRIRASPPPELFWASEAQFWSYVIWGKGGLAVHKIFDEFALSQILKYDTWRSPDALADEIDRLAVLGDWNGPEALAQDPAMLCPPELDVDLSLRKQGIRPAAHFYARAAKANDSPEEALQYAEEALRLAPRWKWLQGYVRELRLSTARAD